VVMAVGAVSLLSQYALALFILSLNRSRRPSSSPRGILPAIPLSISRSPPGIGFRSLPAMSSASGRLNPP
jgi:hypothetical protein